MLNLNNIKIAKKSQEDPLFFIREVLGWKPYQKQIDIINAVGKYEKTAVAVSHGTGLTATLARLALWHFINHPYSYTFVTAPTARQINTIFFPELEAASTNSLLPLPSIELKQPQSPDYIMKPGWELKGFTSIDKVRGLRGSSTLWVLDCASGIHDDTWGLVLDSLKNEENVKVVAGGKPDNLGRFFDFYKGKDVFDIRISAFDTPNVLRENFNLSPIPEYSKLMTSNFVRDLAQHGVDSPIYRSGVLAEFPISQPVTQKVKEFAAVLLERGEAWGTQTSSEFHGPEGFLPLPVDIIKNPKITHIIYYNGRGKIISVKRKSELV